MDMSLQTLRKGVETEDPGLAWLLESRDPSVRFFALTELKGAPLNSKEAVSAQRLILTGSRVKALLAGQRRDGGFGVHPYQKWTGAHWRLVSLIELGMPEEFPPAVRATNLVLKWLLGEPHLNNVPKINGLYRRCASQEGNALGVCSRLGMANDPRVRQLAESLAEWQWPDGGWNCDRKPEAHHSSFNESLPPLWGLTEYCEAVSDKKAREACDKAAEFLLKHRIFKSCRTDKERRPETFHGEVYRMVHRITELHYPPYWHYDFLQALIVLQRAGRLADSRTADALDLLQSKRGSDGLWKPEGYYWNMKRKTKAKLAVSNVEIVDWGRAGPNDFITLNALRVLKGAGRLGED